MLTRRQTEMDLPLVSNRTDEGGGALYPGPPFVCSKPTRGGGALDMGVPFHLEEDQLGGGIGSRVPIISKLNSNEREGVQDPSSF